MKKLVKENLVDDFERKHNPWLRRFCEEYGYELKPSDDVPGEMEAVPTEDNEGAGDVTWDLANFVVDNWGTDPAPDYPDEVYDLVDLLGIDYGNFNVTVDEMIGLAEDEDY